MHQELRRDADKLRDRLYEHEKATATSVTDCATAIDALSEEMASVNGVDGDRIKHLADTVHALMGSQESQWDINEAVLDRLGALEKAAEKPETHFKLQYRRAVGDWHDYEPTLNGWMDLSAHGGSGNSLIQMRIVRK
jgi:hypothetical protein